MLKQKLLAITLSSLILSTTSLGFTQSHQPAPSTQVVATAQPTVWSVAASKKAQSLHTLNLPNSQEPDDTVLASTDGQAVPLVWITTVAILSAWSITIGANRYCGNIRIC